MVAQVIRFGLIGIGATVIHLAIGLMLIHAGWSPLIANVVAFVFAFFVSFAGHFGYTFAGQSTDPASAFVRFIVVAVVGFSFNETVLAIMLQFDVMEKATAFVLSTLAAAIITFVLSRNWAFRTKRAQI